MTWIQQQLLSARDLIFALSKAVIAFSTQTASELAHSSMGSLQKHQSVLHFAGRKAIFTLKPES